MGYFAGEKKAIRCVRQELFGLEGGGGVGR